MDTTDTTNWTTYAYGFLTIFVGFVGAPLAGGGLLLVFASATEVARALGAGCILLAVALQPIAWRRRVFGASCAISAALTLASVATARDSAPPAASRAARVIGGATEQAIPMRWLTELDQIFVGATLTDWFATEVAVDVATLRDDLRAVYGEYQAELVALPSLVGDAAEDTCSGRTFVWDAGRTAGAADVTPRSLVVVHGYGGSWSGHLRVLRPVALATGATLVQPSCGVGRWERDEDLIVVSRTLEQAAQTESARVDVVAITNGGLAISRRLGDVVEHASSLAFVSPMFDLEALAATTQPSRRLPVLVLHGDADRRVPTDHVDAGVERLERLGFDVRRVVLPGAGHDAFFHDRDAVRRELAAFHADVARPRRR